MAEEYNAFDGMTGFNADQPASLLDLAQKVHDDYVEKGKATAAKLEADAQAKHDELVSSAQEFHDISILEAESNAASIIEEAQLAAFSTLSDANLKAASILANIEDNKVNLEASILKLQEFEATYRSQLQALVSGAQATLAVAALVVEDDTLPDSSTADVREQTEAESVQVDEASAGDESDIAEVSYHINVNPGPSFFDDSVADDDVAEVNYTDAVDDSESTTSEENSDSENAEDDSAEAADYTLTEEFAPKLEHYTLDDTTESTSSDSIDKTNSINAETVASILASSGLTDKTIIDEGPVEDDATEDDKK